MATSDNKLQRFCVGKLFRERAPFRTVDLYICKRSLLLQRFMDYQQLDLYLSPTNISCIYSLIKHNDIHVTFHMIQVRSSGLFANIMYHYQHGLCDNKAILLALGQDLRKPRTLVNGERRERGVKVISMCINGTNKERILLLLFPQKKILMNIYRC